MRSRRITGRRRSMVLLAASILVAMGALPGTTLGAPPKDQLPDLRMLRPKDVQVVKYVSGAFQGHRLLRFTTTITNEGAGPLELRGKRTCMSLDACPTMTVRQRVRRTDGSWRSISTTATMRYEVGDGHHHWHAVGLESYRLWRLGVADTDPMLSAKFGFCFFDGRRQKPSAPTKARYVQLGGSSNPGCGTPFSLKTLVGLSAGWADIYPWNFAGQYIDVTGTPKGEYLLCVRADPKQRFLQSNTHNDEAWVRLRIAGSTVTLRESRRSSCSSELARWAPTATSAAALVASAAATASSYAAPNLGAPMFVCSLTDPVRVAGG